MTKSKIKPFCVDILAENLSDADITQLYSWCCRVLTTGEDTAVLDEWIKDKEFYNFVGISTSLELYNFGYFSSQKLIPFSEVHKHLFGEDEGLEQPLSETPEETHSKTLTAAAQEVFTPKLSDCIHVDYNSSEAHTQVFMNDEDDIFFTDMLTYDVSSAIIKYGLVLECSQGEDGVVYKVIHPCFEGEFSVNSLEDFLDLVKGFDILCRYRVN